METYKNWTHEIKLAHLREQLNVVMDQLDRGEGIPIASTEALDILFAEIRENAG